MSLPRFSAPSDLSVGEWIAESYKTAVRALPQILIPLLVYVGANIVLFLPAVRLAFDAAGVVGQLAASFLSFFVYVWLGLRVCGFTLFGSANPGSIVTRMDWRALGSLLIVYVGFAVVGLTIGLAVGPTPQPGAATPQVPEAAFLFAMLLFLIAGLYVTTRVALIVPAAATDASFPLKESWRVTEGRFWRVFGRALALFLTFLVALFPLMLWMEGAVIDALRNGVSLDDPEAIYDAMFVPLVAANVVGAPLAVVGFAAAALLYRQYVAEIDRV